MNTSTLNWLFDNRGSLVYQTASKSFVYTLERPDLINSKPATGTYTYYSLPITSDDTYLGFKATVTSDPSQYVGFIFNYTSATSYYFITIHDGSFSIGKKRNSNDPDSVVGWTSSDAINEQEEGNEVIVYKNGSSLIVQINGTTVHTLENPSFTHGQCGVLCSVSGEECQSRDTVSATYKFTSFQVR